MTVYGEGTLWSSKKDAYFFSILSSIRIILDNLLWSHRNCVTHSVCHVRLTKIVNSIPFPIFWICMLHGTMWHLSFGTRWVCLCSKWGIVRSSCILSKWLFTCNKLKASPFRMHGKIPVFFLKILWQSEFLLCVAYYVSISSYSSSTGRVAYKSFNNAPFNMTQIFMKLIRDWQHFCFVSSIESDYYNLKITNVWEPKGYFTASEAWADLPCAGCNGWGCGMYV